MAMKPTDARQLSANGPRLQSAERLNGRVATLATQARRHTRAAEQLDDQRPCDRGEEALPHVRHEEVRAGYLDGEQHASDRCTERRRHSDRAACRQHLEAQRLAVADLPKDAQPTQLVGDRRRNVHRGTLAPDREAARQRRRQSRGLGHQRAEVQVPRQHDAAQDALHLGDAAACVSRARENAAACLRPGEPLAWLVGVPAACGET